MDLNKMATEGFAELAKLLLQKEELENKIKATKEQLVQIQVLQNYEKQKAEQPREAEVVG